ncbi:hypothetical protein XI09_40940 [Bradyrhizobium sp. CCBAU 11386]|uniref:hypothetical protein n=1 Tax=Bradyrhizobium sp. CCBAU 11386 TaxID=1630837 RepID=UPI002304B29A|nr:hypothetical protein [Bradyrhizobium sp. CCBAU 11386]MDA9510917.1 hypothetical protein [Bradyrhizobium sp. CCBAU 11386]
MSEAPDAPLGARRRRAINRIEDGHRKKRGQNMIDGAEILSLRQRRSTTGETYFTGRMGAALVVLVRDDVERDVWRLIATDPSPGSTRNDALAPARAIAPPADDTGWYQTEMDDDLPEGIATE